ncbi:MAG: hypothetical protein LBN41_09750 [Enterobacteriaceae bacterium]|jgi:hypothetical protein|nr:hypothetical protein [Enterobacteriaceae bacterium]
MKGCLKYVRYLVLVIVVVAGFFIWKWQSLKNEAELAFNQNSVAVKYLGKIHVESMGFSEYEAQCQTNGCDRYSIKLRGEKGNATAVTDLTKGSPELSYAILCLSNGTSVALTEDAEMIMSDGQENSCQ